MSKHTPAPWEIYDPCRADAHYGIDGPNGEAVVGFGDPGEWGGIPELANAHLIAAAPRLLTAAEGLLDFIRRKYPDDFVEGGRGFTCEHHIELAAAIAQARNEGVDHNAVND